MTSPVPPAVMDLSFHLIVEYTREPVVGFGFALERLPRRADIVRGRLAARVQDFR